MIKRLLIILLLSITSLQALAENAFNHTQWDQLLKRHVININHGVATEVDYQGMAKERATLKVYLDKLSRVSQVTFDQWDKSQQLAFLINAYNAWTVEFILTRYPDIKSIKDLGSFLRSPWSKTFIPLFGKMLSLDDIEQDLIRHSGRYNDPRIHFAVNCASIGCPALRAEAYSAAKLDEQLKDQTRLFLSDHRRNRLKKDELQVSSIFKWYREDFEKGWQGIHSIQELFIQHAEEMGLNKADVENIQAGKIEFEFLDYNWLLNDKK
ncbi:MAG: DUF547 domain-containing protein [Pseudomonadales bacterium]|nr:DUF547 domain-containing protein [Pseudomonadales bacterium]